MKNLPVLTNNEKIELLARNKINAIDEKIKYNYFNMKLILATELFACLVAIPALVFGGGLSAPIVTSILSLLFALSTPVFMMLPISCLIPALKEFKTYSSGKLSYRKYKKLVKSGEIAKWEQQFSEQIEQRVNQIKGIQTEEYKRDVEQQIVRNVYNDLQNTNGVELDSNKVAEAVKKLINENNERNK